MVIGYILARLLTQAKSNGEILPSVKGKFEIAHRLPGRIRFRIMLLAGQDDKIIDSVKTELLNIAAVKSVQINPVSTSLIVEYDEEKIDATIIHGILLKLLDLDELFDRPLESLAQRELKQVGSSINRKVYDTTAGLLDVTSALSLSIFLLGLYQILAESL
jgi:hypothetical protein